MSGTKSLEQQVKDVLSHWDSIQDTDLLTVNIKVPMYGINKGRFETYPFKSCGVELLVNTAKFKGESTKENDK